MLIRWAHPELGVLRPLSFSDKFDRIASDIVYWEKLNSARAALIEREGGSGDLTFSFPLTARYLSESRNIEILISAYLKLPLKPNKMCIEVLDWDLSRVNSEIFYANLQRIRAAGLQIGATGVAESISLLNHASKGVIDYFTVRLPAIKTSGGEIDMKVLNALIAMSTSLDIDMVVTLVEDKEDFEVLTSAGVQYLEGYYFNALSTDARETQNVRISDDLTAA